MYKKRSRTKGQKDSLMRENSDNHDDNDRSMSILRNHQLEHGKHQ
jgi:hypothetical protein